MSRTIPRLGLLGALVLAGCGPSLPDPGAPGSSTCATDVREQCLGPVRALPYLRERAEQGHAASIRRVAILNDRASIPALRAALRPGRGAQTRVAAAAALVDLGDPDAPVAELCEQLETVPTSARWDDCVEVLERLEGPALSYARAWAARNTALPDVRAMRRAMWVADRMREGGAPSDLPILNGWAQQVEGREGGDIDARALRARLTAARIRLGDEPLRTREVTALGTPEASVPLRPEIVLLGLGTRPDEAPALARFASSTPPEATVAYDGLDALAPRLDEAQRAALRARLEQFSAMRDDPGHANFRPALLARHDALLARLGDPAAPARLLALAAHPDGRVAYVAARHALELGLDGAADAAASVLSRGRLPEGDRVPGELRHALLETAVSTLGERDGRWAIALLDGRLQPRATHHLARHPGAAGACDAVHVGLQSDVVNHVIGDAVRALVLLGDRCVPQLVDSAERAPRSIRHPALRALGMIRAPELEPLAERWAQHPGTGPTVRAALDVYHRPD